MTDSTHIPKPCIGVVDDDESICESLSRLLRAAGYQSATYRSAEALLEDPQRSRFSCLILDLQLGGMSGIELSERLAALGSTTPVVFITAHDEPEARAEALATGCVAYLRKTEPRKGVLAALTQAIHSSTTPPEGL